MAGEITGFIHKDGRVIPIHAASGSRSAKFAKAAAHGTRIGHAATAAVSVARTAKAASIVKKHGLSATSIKPNKGLKLASEGLSVAEGIGSAWLLTKGIKGAVASIATGAAGEIGIGALGAAAYAGKGKTKERAIAMGKQEAKLQALGWTAFGATLAGTKAGRETMAETGKAAVKFTAKHLGNLKMLARKAFGAV